VSGLTTALVGVDRSPGSQPLLGCLPDLSEWGIRRIVLAHVMTVSYGQFGAFGHESHCRDWLEQQAETVAGAGFEVAVDVTVSGAPADELVAAAQRHDADLLVIGSRSHNLVRGLFLGGVARGVIGRSTVPVLIERIEPTAPETEQLCAAVCERTLEHVVLATDGSQGSEGAEEMAVLLAGRAGTTEVVTVREPADDRSDSALEAHLGALAARVRAAGGTAAVGVIEGDPSTELMELVEQRASLVIVGRHGRSRVTQRLVGHTAERISERSGRPVLLVPGVG
jgi:nucleotide-binding universal stress UspA family protein